MESSSLTSLVPGRDDPMAELNWEDGLEPSPSTGQLLPGSLQSYRTGAIRSPYHMDGLGIQKGASRETWRE